MFEALEKVIAYQEYLQRFEKRGLARQVLQLLLDQEIVSKESLRQEEQLQGLVAAFNAAGGLRARLEPDEEHHAWAIIITPESREAGEMRLDWDLLGGSDFQALVRLSGGIQDFQRPPHLLEGKDRTWEFPTREDMVTFILEEGQKGINIQRFKGLGEMNPEQLWETTMEPTNRTLLQVKIEDAVESDEIFTILMGDQVEPRRDFIETNALNVVNLDI